MINSTISNDASSVCIIEIPIYSELFARNALTNKELDVWNLKRSECSRALLFRLSRGGGGAN